MNVFFYLLTEKLLTLATIIPTTRYIYPFTVPTLTPEALFAEINAKDPAYYF